MTETSDVNTGDEVPAATRLPTVTSILPTPSVDGCAHFGVAEIELGGLQRRFGGLHIGDGFAIGVIALVVVTPGHDVITDKLRAAFELAGGEHHTRLGGFKLGLGLVDLRRIRRGIDLEQQIARLHQLTLGEIGRLDRACNPRAELDPVDGFQAPGEIVPQAGLARLDHRHRDRNRGFSRGNVLGRLGGILKVATGQRRAGRNNGDQDGKAEDDVSEFELDGGCRKRGAFARSIL